MTLSFHLEWSTKQIDFTNAFVQENLDYDIYLNLPPGFIIMDGTRNSILKLNKSLYGLVQSPKAWNEHLTEALIGLRYRSSQSDPCMFYGKDLILLIYVDNVLVFGKSDDVIRL